MIPLREFQRIGVDRVRLSFKSGHRAPLIVGPTGMGKAVVLAHIAHAHVMKGGTVNMYCHRRELCAQVANKLRAYGLSVAIDGLNRGAPVRVLSIQGVLASGEVPSCTLAIVDEAHHISESAEEWYKIAEAHKDVPIVGATATPIRGDGSPLSPPFDDMIVFAQVSELINLGYLTPVEVIRPSRRLKSGKLAQSPLNAYRTKTPGQRAVVFAQHVPAAEKFAQEFRDAGIEAQVIHGKTPAELRDRHLARFQAGELRVLVNVYVLTEGWDCPPCSSIIIARSVGSVAMYMQMIGRGMRPAPGKTLCTVLDLSGCSHTFGRPDQEWEFSLDGDGMKAKGASALDRLCKTCGTPLGDLVVCAECGRDHEMEFPEITDEKIDKFAWMKKDGEEQRIKRLTRWIQEARTKGYKLGWALGKYKGVYGEFPPRNWTAIAQMGEMK